MKRKYLKQLIAVFVIMQLVVFDRLVAAEIPAAINRDHEIGLQA